MDLVPDVTSLEPLPMVVWLANIALLLAVIGLILVVVRRYRR